MSPHSASQPKSSRNLVFSDGGSHKFWRIELDGSSHSVTFGRVGTSGQTQTKEYDSEEAARKAYDKLIAEKTKKGYVDADGAGAADGARVADGEGAASSVAATSTTEASTKKAASAKGKLKRPKASEPTDTAAGEASAPAAAADVDLSIERTIELTPRDWYRATFRSLEPLDRGAPAPFDKDECLKRLAKLKTNSYGWRVSWGELKLPEALSKEEASFWLMAMSEPRSRETSMKALAEKVATKKLNTVVGVDDCRQQIAKFSRDLPSEAGLLLSNLLSPEEYVELALDVPATSKEPWEVAGFIHTLMAGFREHVVPYLDSAQRASLRDLISKRFDPKGEAASSRECFPPEFYLAAAIGMHDAIYEATSHLPDDHYAEGLYAGYYQRPQDLVFGLGSPELVAGEWRRLKVRMFAEDDIRAFLACTEYSALDVVADVVIAETNKEKCEEFLKAFLLVKAPEAAEPVLRCKLEAKTPALAREWLDHNLGRATLGLIQTAAGRGKLADAAIDYLRSVKRKGFEAVIASALKQIDDKAAVAKVQAEVLDREEKVYEPLDASSTPQWLASEIEAAGAVKRKTLPSWANPGLLPPLLVGQRRLSDDQVALVLQLLMATPITEKHPLLVALRNHAPKSSRDEFAWRLFQHWQEGGYPPKEKWAMGAVAHLGDDGCVMKLTPLIRVWPGESQHARAVSGLECLRAIGSTTALMSLSGIAQKLKFKGLKGKAEEFVTQIAVERGLTRSELEDRVVPDCGLDEQGRREFSFGPRSFSFVLGGDLKAMVRDESGKLRSDLPSIGAKDDPALATESVAEWKLLKKQIKEVAAIQAARLEQAMVTGRRWKREDFETLLVRHPLMTHLAQKLVWGGFDEHGKLLKTFRVTEERDFANEDDDAITLDGIDSVGVIHPLELSDQQRARWGEVLGDYEIVSPFGQLGRAVYSLEPAEEKEQDLKRFQGLQLVAPTLVFTLEKLGWTRGTAMDGGCFDEHSKQFPAANVTAVIGYEGTVGMGYIDPNETLKIDTVHFCPGMRPPSGYRWDSKDRKMTLGQVPPIVISEVLADLQVLKSKAK